MRATHGWMVRIVLPVILPALFCAFSSEEAAALGKRKPKPHELPTQMPEAKAHGSMNLKVTSFNLNGLPFPGKRPQRYAQIGRVLAQKRAEGNGPKIVFLQEAFDPRTDDVVRYAGYPYFSWGPPAKGLRSRSGIVMLSEYPMETSEYTVFAHCTSWDCYSRKGIQFAKIQIPGVPTPIAIYNTHMNSNLDTDFWSEPEMPYDTRITQIQDFKEFIWQTNPNNMPALYAGDFNFRTRHDDYLFFISLTMVFDVGDRCETSKICAPSLTFDWRDAIDRHFFSPGGGLSIEPIHVERNMTELYENKPLSDHQAYEVDYRLRW